MHELTGRIESLDPQASQSLKVISYFDALINGKVSVEALLRATATLTGCACGYRPAAGRSIRLSLDGQRTSPQFAPDQGGQRLMLDDGGRLWLERDGVEHANDALVLERLALAIAIAQGRIGEPQRHLELALAEGTAEPDRAAAIAALQLPSGQRVKVLACRVEFSLPDAIHQAVLSTRHGLVRAGISTQLDRDFNTVRTPLGIGRASFPAQLRDSWQSALVALLIATPDEPVVDAAELGAVIHLGKVPAEQLAADPDVIALAVFSAEHAWALNTVDALCHSTSLRAAAARLGLHHSTVQHRVAELHEALAVDPLNPAGIFRLNCARIALRLSQT